MVGGPQIRNAGTIGGKHLQRRHLRRLRLHPLCPWDAIIELTVRAGRPPACPIQDFYLGAGRVDIRPDEIQTAILIPRL